MTFKMRLESLRVRWLEWRIHRLKLKIGTKVMTSSTPSGASCFYIGTDFTHPLYPKLEKLEAELKSKTVWSV